MMNFNAIDMFLEQCVEKGAFSCAAAGVGVSGQTLHACVRGRLSVFGEVLADMDTRFDLASLTKVFAPAMLVLMALEEGKLTLSDTLAMYTDAPEDKKDITILQLMTHTSGLHPSISLEERCAHPREAEAAILSSALEHPAGSMVDYSCMGYILLGIILERIYGKPLNELSSDKVFEPLGMRKTGYLPKGNNFAATECVLPDGSALSGVVHDENARYLGGVSANAGVFSPLPDCLSFAAMLSREGEPLLSKGVFRLAVSDLTPNMPLHRGLGFYLPIPSCSFAGDLFPRGSYGHTGFTGTSFLVDPNTGFYAVLLTNAVHPERGQTDMLSIRARFHNMAYAAYTAYQESQ